MELVRLAYYPFRPEVRDAVRDADIALDEVLTSAAYASVRKRAEERLRGSIEDGFERARVMNEREALTELLSVAIARMACVALNDRQLTRRYATAEASQLEGVLNGQPEDIESTARVLGLELSAMDEGNYPWRVPVPQYLVTAPVTRTDWKMMLRPVSAGMVHLSQDDAVGLCREALRARIETELEAERERPLPEPLKLGLEPIVYRLTPILEEAREQWNTGDFGPIQPGLFPPCMNWLFELMNQGKNIPHHGRFAFASFMGNIGMNAEQIMDHLAATPNFDREKSRYQIEHITGERGVDKYTPPGCQSMQTNGICPLERRDGLCAKISHPLSYYRAKIRFQAEDQKKADAALAKQQAAQGTAASAPESTGQATANPREGSEGPPPATPAPTTNTSSKGSMPSHGGKP